MSKNAITELLSKDQFFLIAGPCVVESEYTTLSTAERLKEICQNLNLSLIFKASFRKANRTSHLSFSGIGDDEALRILQKVRIDLEMPVTTDVHETQEISKLEELVDLIQIPAFLCRQTDLLQKAGKTGLPINIKKGQFMSAKSMKFATDKITAVGNSQVIVTERGNSFGYEDLVVDFTNIPRLKSYGIKTVVDCSHSLQKPNAGNGTTGGNPDFIACIAKAATATGADGLFIETHPNPGIALSDSQSMLPLDQIEKVLKQTLLIRNALEKAEK